LDKDIKLGFQNTENKFGNNVKTDFNAKKYSNVCSIEVWVWEKNLVGVIHILRMTLLKAKPMVYNSSRWCSHCFVSRVTLIVQCTICLVKLDNTTSLSPSEVHFEEHDKKLPIIVFI
jgi:hypothetical protein